MSTWLRRCVTCSALACASASAARCASTWRPIASALALAASIGCAGVIEVLRRLGALGSEGLDALVAEARILERGDRFGLLRLGRGEHRLLLLDLFSVSALLPAERCLALAHLRRVARGAVLVVRLVGGQLARVDDGEELVLGDAVALGDQEAAHRPADLRARRRRREW